MAVNVFSDDGTHLKAVNLMEGVKNIHLASKKFGKDMNTTSTWKSRLEQAGFVNVVDKTYKVIPTDPWTTTHLLTRHNSSRKAPGPKTPK